MVKSELKDSLHKALDTIEDETLLKAIYTLMIEYRDNEIVGYTGATPLSRADLIKQAFKAEEDILKGKTYDAEAVRTYFKNKAIR